MVDILKRKEPDFSCFYLQLISFLFFSTMWLSLLDFPGGSYGKESACNSGDLG